jgi:WD40 repeat protein
MPLVATAHDNGTLNFFDFNANKVVKTINDAHTDGISSLAFSNSGLHLISGCHDGSIKVWDVRNHKMVSENNKAHSRKFDEGVLSLVTH